MPPKPPDKKPQVSLPHGKKCKDTPPPEKKRRGVDPNAPPDAYTVAKFSELVSFDRHTLAMRISELGAVPKGKTLMLSAPLYSLRDLVRAILGGDIEAEKLRKVREEADKIAIQNAKSRAELVDIHLIKKLGEKVMVAMRNRILNMPLSDEEKDKCLTDLLELSTINWTNES